MKWQLFAFSHRFREEVKALGIEEALAGGREKEAKSLTLLLGWLLLGKGYEGVEYAWREQGGGLPFGAWLEYKNTIIDLSAAAMGACLPSVIIVPLARRFAFHEGGNKTEFSLILESEKKDLSGWHKALQARLG